MAILAGWFNISVSSHMATSQNGMIMMYKLFNSEYLKKCPTVCPTNLRKEIKGHLKNELEISFS